VLNKCDLLSAAELAELTGSLAERFPDTQVLTMSALKGDGVDAWLEWLQQGRPAGSRIAAVDYDTYAAGEAALAWLNASARLHTDSDADWGAFANELLEGIRTDLRAVRAEIAHLKLHLAANAGHIAGNLTGNDAATFLRGAIGAACRDARLVINARVHSRPEQLRTVVKARLQSAAEAHRIESTIINMRSFFPGSPQPTHRYQSIAQAPDA
jgi:G3E family GTPase